MQHGADGRIPPSHPGGAGSARDAVNRFAQQASGWPSVLRDIGAASLTLWAVFVAELLATVLPLRTEVLLAAPGALAAWWIFGGTSALFATLVAASVVHLMAAERSNTLFSFGTAEMAAPACLGLILVATCLMLRIALARRERRAVLQLRASAEEAMARAAAADARLAAVQAEARLTQRPGSVAWHDPFANALRQEGGV